LLDRIDIHVEVVPVPFKELSDSARGEASNLVRERVVKARKIQEDRFLSTKEIHCNAQMNPKQLVQYCEINEAGQSLLKTAMERLNLSARAYDRILKVSRTIADLEGSPHICTEHLAEAIHYRSLDKGSWGA